MRMEDNVLGGRLTLQEIVVVDAYFFARPIRFDANDIHFFGLRKITEASGECNGVQNGYRMAELKRAWLLHFADHIEPLALGLLNDHGDLRMLQILFQVLRNRVLNLPSSQSGNVQ